MSQENVELVRGTYESLAKGVDLRQYTDMAQFARATDTL